MLTVTYSARSHAGNAKGNNGDNLYCDGASITPGNSGKPFGVAGLVRAPCLFAVCGGMEWQKDMEAASMTAVSMLSRYSRAILTASPGDIDAVVGEYVACVNASLCGKARAATGGGAGTALALAAVAKSSIRAYAMGGSRIYLMKSGRLRQVTKDRAAAERINIVPAITVSDKCRLLICSDGLTDMVGDGQIRVILQEGGDVANAGKSLVEAALANGGGDDVTCVVLDIASDKY